MSLIVFDVGGDGVGIVLITHELITLGCEDAEIVEITSPVSRLPVRKQYSDSQHTNFRVTPVDRRSQISRQET